MKQLSLEDLVGTYGRCPSMRHRCSLRPSGFSSFSSGLPFVLISSLCKITRPMNFRFDALILSCIQSCVLSQDFSYRSAPNRSTRYDCCCAVFYRHVRNDCHRPMVSTPLRPPRQGIYASYFSVPIHAFWDIEDRVHARCVNVNLLFLVAGGINCALDALIVFMV